MIGVCLRCGEKFELNKQGSRLCGRHKREYKRPDYDVYINNLRARFQNVKVQYFRLWHSEDISMQVAGIHVDPYYLEVDRIG